jgi:hypothetical protein
MNHGKTPEGFNDAPAEALSKRLIDRVTNISKIVGKEQEELFC